ncbi:MAG: cation:proton antiporter [Dehalococcoidia bacterium]|nr:cation:proton antiporter [Dehalococcoidia bacterium]
MEQTVTEIAVRLVYQLAFILLASKLGGELCVRFLKIPSVLGELGAGILIGPFALGGVAMAGFGPIFPMPDAGAAGSTGIPISPELYSFSQAAAIVLLFTAGLDTNLKQFLKYAGPALLIATGGVLLPFFLGAWATVLFGFAQGFGDPRALFMGAVLTATSVGITARVLNDLRQLDSSEGVTVIAAAVVDDVLGILVLTVVVGISASGSVSLAQIGFIGAKALGFWVALTGAGILLSKPLSRLLESFRVPGAGISLSLALAFLAAGLAQSVGLAMIIGAYSIGLALSSTSLARKLQEQMAGVYHAYVPVFFVVMGMLVDISAVEGSLVFALVVTSLAIVGKLFGCGLPALATGFNFLGASRVGIGMLPRGEVALIIAGIGLAYGVIDADLFGVAILMTVATTFMSPILLVPLFRRGGSGRRREEVQAPENPS